MNLVADYGYDYLNRLRSYRSFVTDGVTSTADDTTSYTHDALDRVARETESHLRARRRVRPPSPTRA